MHFAEAMMEKLSRLAICDEVLPPLRCINTFCAFPAVGEALVSHRSFLLEEGSEITGARIERETFLGHVLGFSAFPEEPLVMERFFS